MAAGTIVQSMMYSRVRDLTVWTVTLVYTAGTGGSAGSVSAALDSKIMGGTNNSPGGGIGGAYLFKIRRIPAAAPSTPPSGNYTVTLTDGDGVDLMGGVCSANGSATLTLDNVPMQDTNANLFGPVYLDPASLTINITSAGSGGQGTIRLYVVSNN